MVTVTVAEAQDRFIELLAEARRGPVAITQDGQIIAYLVSKSVMEELRNAQPRDSKS